MCDYLGYGMSWHQQPETKSSDDEPGTLARPGSCSSGQHFASGFLQIRSRPQHPCLWLTLPLAGCVEDFHLQVTSEATTAKLVALARDAPCVAHHKKSRSR